MEGTPFGRYRLASLLGRGGMGEVWRAYDTGTDRVVALKVLPTHFAQDQTFEQRFLREAHAAAQLHNPHVVPIHDYGEIDGRLFVDMALIDGRDLASEIADGPIEPERAVAVVEHIARALQAAHKAGLVHRDVKPSNILLDEDGYAYLIDFGIARAAADTKLTGTGSTIGTWAYMAPERFTTDRVDPSSDIYALTCVLHECLTGNQPYPGDSLERQVAGHLYTPPPRPCELRPGIPATFDDVIATGMAKDPEDRYSNVRDLAAAAREAVTTQPVELVPEPPPARSQIGPTPATDDTVVAATEPAMPHSALTETAPTAVRPSADADAADPPAGRRRRLFVWAAAGAVVLVAIVGTIAFLNRTPTYATATGYGAPTRLPFTGLGTPAGVAVDGAGTVYVVKYGGKVWKLEAGATTDTALPFTGLNATAGVAVDNAGSVYVTEDDDNQVLKLASDGTQTVLPFLGLDGPKGVAVDAEGTIYVADWDNNQVFSLTTGATTSSVLPFEGLDKPDGVAVDTAGNVYVVDGYNDRVLKLAAGTTTQSVLPFKGLDKPEAVAVDTAGNVYVDNGGIQVFMLAAGERTPVALPELPVAGVNGVAVDTAGNVYVADPYGSAVMKLPRN